MSTALVAMQPNGAALTAPDHEERRRLLSDLIMRNGSEAQVDLVMHICDRYRLDPLLKHLVLINGSAYITRDGLLHIAHQSGQFDGIEVALTKLDDGEWAATCTVYRKDKTRPFRYTVYQSEHQQGGGGAWGKYPRAMLAKTAEVACLRRAFDVSLGAVEELGYDGQSSASSIGEVTAIAEGQVVESPVANPVAALVALLNTMDKDGAAFASIVAEAQKYADRLTPEQWAPIKAAVKAIGDRRKAAAKTASADPGYQHHAREDKQPVLGATPDERLAMLARIRAAMREAGKGEEETNRFVYATWRQAGIETLTAEEGEELIRILQARGDEEEAAPTEGPHRFADDGDEVPF